MASVSTAAFTSEMNSAPACEIDENDVRTTLMFRNLPNSYNRAALLNMLDAEGFEGTYTFVYLPTDFKNFAGFGYAFVGFATHRLAELAKRHFQGFTKWKVPSQKTCDVAWSGEVQGLEAYIDKYRNSPVMHDSVPDEYKPALFVNGVRIPFPSPTKRIRPPRVRHMAHMA
jgi:RNA recognition motif-containing protein